MYNRLLPYKSSFTKEKTNVGEEQVPAVSKIEVSQAETVEKELEQKQETEASNVVELETGSKSK